MILYLDTRRHLRWLALWMKVRAKLRSGPVRGAAKYVESRCSGDLCLAISESPNLLQRTLLPLKTSSRRRRVRRMSQPSGPKLGFAFNGGPNGFIS